MAGETRFQRFLATFRRRSYVPSSPKPRANHHRRIRIEPLEDRRLLAVFTVTNLSDGFVDSAGDAPGTLRQAIFDANQTVGHDTIEFDPALTSGGPATIDLQHDELDVTSSLSIVGPGAFLLTIDASPSVGLFPEGARIFDVTDNNAGNLLEVEISGLTLTGASEFGPGGAIRSHENLTLADSIVTGNESGRGGGLYNRYGLMQVVRTAITHNNTPENGGFGSGIANWRGTLLVTDSNVSNNGLRPCSCGSSVGGAGIFNFAGSATITGSQIYENSGGGLYSSGLDDPADVTIIGTTFSGNIHGFLGPAAVSLNATLSYIESSLIIDNEIQGIFNRLEKLTISASTVSGNHDETNGGGIHNLAADLTIDQSTISGNDTTGSGGGIYHAGGNLAITGSTISGNTAGAEGGGLRLSTNPYNTESVDIENSTISGNAAAIGGGVWNRTFAGDTFELAHSTVTGNTGAFSGGGLYFFFSYGADSIDHTIVAANFGGDSVDIGGEVDARYSLIGNDTGATITDDGGNLIGSGASPIDPLLAPLADNGGPTFTHRLRIGSPALDSGDPAAVAGLGGVPDFDQRDNPFSRAFDGDGDSHERIDIGAFESEAIFLVVDTLDDENDGDHSEGDLSLREAIELSNASFAVETIGFDADLDGQTIVLIHGELLITSPVFIDTAGLPNRLTVDASGNDLNPEVIDGFGSRVVAIDDGDDESNIAVSISGLVLTGADHADNGGAIFNRENLTLIDSQITGNAATWGAGIYNDQYAELGVVGSTISGNTAGSSGGAIYNYGGTATIEDSTVSGNFAPEGGGIYNVNGGFLDLLRSSVIENAAAVIGGGILNHGYRVTVVESTISGNSAATGAGINNDYGYLSVSRSTISGNIASGSGGGIANNFGQLNVAESTLTGNTATYGGGLYIAGNIFNTTTVSNSTISGNTATSAGGGVYNFQGFVIIGYSTITANEAPADSGGGVASWPDPFTATTTVRSSIIAGNVGGDLLSDDGALNSFVSDGHNLVGVGNGESAFNNDDLTGVLEPLLAPLADNGGPTFTHALLLGSPAIDAGDPSAVPGGGPTPVFDQRGESFERIRDGDSAAGAVIDIGAFELQLPHSGPDLPGDYNDDGTVDAADYIIWRKTLGDSVAAFSAADGNGDGQIDHDDYDVWTAHFGQSLPGTAASEQVPQPSASSTHDHEFVAAPDSTQDIRETDEPGAGSGGPLANLVIDSVVFVDPFGTPVATPVVGQKVYVLANWRTTDLGGADQYIVRFHMDGSPVESSVISGSPGTNSPYWWWHGGWLATPGMHTISVTVDAGNSITETNEADNTFTFNFTAETPDLPQQFVWPLAGTQNVDWVVEGYLDADPRPGFDLFADYQGRGATYDGHNGIDIALPHFAAMDAGVPVLAAAAGTVTVADDGHYDRWLSPPFPYPDPNMVIIDHGNGWHTAYLHLRRDSITVSPGQAVSAGQQIGLVGSSGYSFRPHLHFEVLHDGTPVEPFVAPSTYFLSPLPYTFDAPKTLLDFGITNVPPPFEAIAEHASDIDSFPQTGSTIFFQAWAIFASLEAGDTWEVQLFQPNGTLYSDFPPVDVSTDAAWNWSYWFGNLPPNPALGEWRADWIINGAVVAQKYYTVSTTARPEIRVYRDDALDLYGTLVDEIVIDGRTTPIGYGAHDKGATAPTRVITVENHGYAPLLIAGVDLPSGFSLLEPLAASIGVGASDTFTVRLDTTVPGYKSGQIVIHSNDLSEPATSFAVEGLVLPTLPGDYNNDNSVNAADYVTWRKALTTTVPAFQGADGDGDGSVTNQDRTIWAAHFDQSAGSGSGVSSTNTRVAATPTFLNFSPTSTVPTRDEPQPAGRSVAGSSQAHDEALVAWLVSRAIGNSSKGYVDDAMGSKDDAQINDDSQPNIEEFDAVFAAL